MNVVAAFAASFAIAALAAFGVVSIAAARLGVGDLPFGLRLALGGAGMSMLALADVRAMLRSTYCPIGWRRQTPRALMRRHHMFVVATLWGLDTGLVVTTFRVAAVGWAALYLAALDLAPWWTGLAYSAGFIAPFTALIVRPQLGRAARAMALADPGCAETSTDPGLEAMLGMRARMQGLSALLLAGAAVGFALRFVFPTSGAQ